MMDADVSSAGIVILSSLCWDEETKIKMAQKLLNELPVSALVVDYSMDTFKVENLMKKSGFPNLEGKSQSFVKAFERSLVKYFDQTFPYSTAYKVPNQIEFELEGIVAGRTSWTNDQKLYLYGTRFLDTL
jgi:hypothetical protein